MRPKFDGDTIPLAVEDLDHPHGTRIEIGFGVTLPDDPHALSWVQSAQDIANEGKSYSGATSALWYDAAHFHELLLASGAQPVRSLIAQFDGCSGAKAGEIVNASGFSRIVCNDLDRKQALELVNRVRAQVKLVTPQRLGPVGRDCFAGCYAQECGFAFIKNSTPRTEVPFVVEVWAEKLELEDVDDDDLYIDFLINRTPSVAPINVYRDSDKDLTIVGNGLRFYTKDAPKKGNYAITVNVTTPYCPITSDGKAPDLTLFGVAIRDAIVSAMRKAQRAAPKDKKLSQKDVILNNLDDVVTAVSGGGEYRFNSRQILYRMRPIVMAKTGQELQLGNFTAIITDHENENGEIPGMYREPRGSIYHPHLGETITLGTLMVEQYERPIWYFNKFVYIEKEGANEALKEVRWGERHDCSIGSSKGFTTRAIRDLIR